MSDIFISYNLKNKDLVDNLYAKLFGIDLTVWLDIRDLNQTNESLTLQSGFYLTLKCTFNWLQKILIKYIYNF